MTLDRSELRRLAEEVAEGYADEPDYYLDTKGSYRLANMLEPKVVLALLDENDRLREALQRLVLVALPVWEQRLVDNYLRREGYAALDAARAALESSEGTDETPPKGIR